MVHAQKESVSHLGVGAVVNQQFHDAYMASLTSPVQRCPPHAALSTIQQAAPQIQIYLSPSFTQEDAQRKGKLNGPRQPLKWMSFEAVGT